jgi:hypothetical protein
MRHLATNGPHRPAAVPAIASPARLSHAGNDTDYHSYVQAHARTRPILTAFAVWGIVLACYFILLAPAKADPLPDQARAFNPVMCYELVQDAGRMIAWARWEQGFSLEKTRSAPFPPDTPIWMLTLVQDWITDAYQWQVTDEQILQWAAELGSTDNLPRATQLSSHETIAIWMRRIARQCSARSA